MRSTDPDHLVHMLGHLDRLLVVALMPPLKGSGLGREHWHVLRALSDGQGRSMGELSQLLQLPAATTTRVVDLLAQNMLVYRRRDPGDRRRVLVHLSDTGQETLHSVEGDIAAHAQAILTPLSAQDRRSLAALLAKLGLLTTKKSPEG